MNKKGFIATTLIYSFFLVFAAVLLAFILMALHNKNLISKANDAIRTDLEPKTLGNRNLASYIIFDTNFSDLNTKDIKWIVFYHDNTRTELVSSSIVFSNISLDYINEIVGSSDSACYLTYPRILDKNDIYNKVNNGVDTVKELQAILNVDTKENDIEGRANYLVMDNNIAKRYTYNEPTSNYSQSPSYVLYDLEEYKQSAFLESNLSLYNENDAMNVRIVITLSSNTPITSGDGSYANPYTISSSKCFNDKFLITKILTNGYDNKTNYTDPSISTSYTQEDEGLRTETDDYGTTYYFRGDVNNNYLIFNNMCWRIVRIDGLGNIRLILQNSNEYTNREITNCGDNSLGVQYVELVEDGVRKSKFNYNTISDDNTYVGYMYGETGQTTYDSTHEMLYNSNILSKLKTWYNLHFTTAKKNKLADVVWCNDVGCSSGTCLGQNSGTYNAAYRLNSFGASFNCQSQTDSALGKYSATTTIGGNGKLTIDGEQYKIGTITADEVKFAGGVKNSTSNSNIEIKTYLTKNITESYWTLSPWDYDRTNHNARVATVDSYAKLYSTPVDEEAFIRPMIALKSDTKVHGNGTIRNPYIVE